MKKNQAVMILVLGVILLLGSCAPFGYAIYAEVATEASERMALDNPFSSHSFTVTSTPGTLGKFTLSAQISTASVQEDDTDADTKYKPRFKFPIKYTLTDSNGMTIDDDTSTIAWNEGSLVTTNQNINSVGGTLSVSTSLDKITIPDSGVMTLELTLGEDKTYEAQLSDVKVEFFENMIDNTWYIAAGVIALILGCLLSVVGFIFTLTSSLGNSFIVNADGSVATEVTEAVNVESCRKAMWIHLSSLLCYVIPLANLIIPVALWLSWRNEDPYINEMGKEAVNFNISVTLYYLISILLMIVLIGFLLIFAIAIYQVTFIIIATVSSSKGKPFRYPMIIRFIK